MSSIKSSFADAAGGVAGSLVAMLAFYPIDVLKTNLQAEKSNGESDNNGKIVDKNRNLQTVIRHMRSKYPSNLDFLKALFKGLHFKTAHTTTSSFAYFFIYSWIQSKHKMHALSSPGYRNGGKYQPSTVVRLLLSAIAAMCNTALTLPLDVLASRSQITHTVKPDDHTNQITPPVTSDDEQTLQEEKKEDDTPRTIIPHDSSQKIMENVWRNVNDIDSDGDYDTANEEGNVYNDDGISFDSGDTGKKDESACQASFIEDEDDNISYASTNIDKNEVVNREYEEQVDSGVSKEIPTYVRPLFRVDTLMQGTVITSYIKRIYKYV